MADRRLPQELDWKAELPSGIVAFGQPESPGRLLRNSELPAGHLMSALMAMVAPVDSEEEYHQ